MGHRRFECSQQSAAGTTQFGAMRQRQLDLDMLPVVIKERHDRAAGAGVSLARGQQPSLARRDIAGHVAVRAEEACEARVVAEWGRRWLGIHRGSSFRRWALSL